MICFQAKNCNSKYSKYGKKSIWKRSCMICIRLFQMLLDQCLAPGPVYSHSGTVEG